MVRLGDFYILQLSVWLTGSTEVWKMMEMKPEVKLLIRRKLPQGFLWRCCSPHCSQPQQCLPCTAKSVCSQQSNNSLLKSIKTTRKGLATSKQDRSDQQDNNKKLQTLFFNQHFKIFKTLYFSISSPLSLVLLSTIVTSVVLVTFIGCHFFTLLYQNHW